MSWFGSDEVLVDERPREAVADGVMLERRSLLRLSAATVAAGLAASCAAPASRRVETAEIDALPTPLPPAEANGSLDIAEFIAEMHPRAQRFVASGGEREEAYLMAVGELMTRLETPTPEQVRSSMTAFAEQQPADSAREIWVVMFRLEPGKGFSHHDHRDYNGMILGVEGSAHVTNYDILGPSLVPPPGETFQIRQTRDDIILPGRFSSLGTTLENVHELTAGPEGAVVLDVFTYLKPGARSYFLTVDSTPRDEAQRIYDATWA
ncbi:MAG: hypothetical protein AAGA20_02625 [Planctomycetota bacterium]